MRNRTNLIRCFLRILHKCKNFTQAQIVDISGILRILYVLRVFERNIINLHY